MRTNTDSTAKAFVDLFEKAKQPEQSFTDFPAEQDEEIILNHLRFAEMLFPKSGIALCPVSHVNTQYYSISCEHILGHSQQALLKMTLPDFLNLIHPDDLPSVQQCFFYIKSFRSTDPEHYRFAIQVRIRNNRQEYEHIRWEQVAIKITTNSYLFLMLYSNISPEEKFYHVKLDVYRKVRGRFIKNQTYNPQQKEKDITPRQTDIVRLVIKGFTNQEIADKLGVSVYTVKNHKQTLFRKVNVKNSIELANYVKATHVDL
jgi:DNA-binding CsgD family transcriptional regulator